MSGKGKGGKGKAGGRGGKSTSSSAKAGLQFPVARVGRYLKKGGKLSLMNSSPPSSSAH